MSPSACDPTDAPPRPRWRRGVIGVALFAAAYMLAAIVAALAGGNVEFLFYILVMIGLIGLVVLLHRRVNLPTGLLGCLAAWGGLHMAGGLVPTPAGWPIEGDVGVLYSLWLIPGWLKYDHVVHAFGFGATAWVCWRGLIAIAPAVRPTCGALTLCALAAMGLGAVNEIVEFIATRLGPTNVGGYENTAWDLVANALGATAAVLAIRLGTRR